MTNDEGLQLKIGDEVWQCGVFKSLYMPYIIASEPRLEKDNLFVLIKPAYKWRKDEVGTNGQRMGCERQNVYWLSREHPLGWKIIRNQEEDIDACFR